MTPNQCKMARAGLNWRAADLSEKCGISRVTIARFEGGNPVDADSIEKMRKALADAGADFSRRAGRIGVTVPE